MIIKALVHVENKQFAWRLFLLVRLSGRESRGSFMKKAFITGVTGQDGSYLADLEAISAN